MHAVSCAEYQVWLIDSLAEGARTAPSDALQAHAAACAECRGAADLRATWNALAGLPPMEAPTASRTREMVHQLMASERAAASRRRWFEMGQVPLAVGSGLLVAAATLLLLGGVVLGSTLPHSHVFFCAAMLTGLLVGAFSWIYSASTVNGVHLDAAARVGVLALSIAVAATTACPELNLLAWWDHSRAGHLLTELLGPGGSSVVFGFVYGLFPGFLAALFGGKLLAERPIANGLVAVSVVFLLAIPVIYLQSAPFTSGVIGSWLAGTAAGTLCGVFGAVRVRRRVAMVSVPT
jgi:hypothetical protein